MPIDKTVHFIWLSEANSDLPADMQANVELWRKTHEHYDIRIWSSRDFNTHMPEYYDLAMTCRFIAMRSDLLRLAVLASEGGFYSDLKNRPRRAFVDQLASKSVALVPMHAPTIEGYETRTMNSFLGAPAGSRFMQACLDRVAANVRDQKGTDVVSATGTGPINFEVRRAKENGHDDVEIIPSKWIWGSSNNDAEACLTRTGASYNGPNNEAHWSKRQKIESLYL